MTDRACSEPASFSGYDRRRRAMTLKQTSDIRLFRRVQAVLRVAEGDPIRSVARSLCVSGRSVQRWLEIYRHRRHPEDLLDAPRSGRPRAANDLDQTTSSIGHRVVKMLTLRRRPAALKVPVGGDSNVICG